MDDHTEARLTVSSLRVARLAGHSFHATLLATQRASPSTNLVGDRLVLRFRILINGKLARRSRFRIGARLIHGEGPVL